MLYRAAAPVMPEEASMDDFPLWLKFIVWLMIGSVVVLTLDRAWTTAIPFYTAVQVVLSIVA